MSLPLFLSPNIKTHFNFKINFSHKNIQFNTTKSKRKLRPSFSDQLRDKWSVKNPILFKKVLPWEEKFEKFDQNKFFEDKNEKDEVGIEKDEIFDENERNFGNLAPWVNEKSKNEVKLANSMKVVEKDDNFVSTKEKDELGSRKDKCFDKNERNFGNLAPWVNEKSKKGVKFANSMKIVGKNDNFIEKDEVGIEKDDIFDKNGRTCGNLAPSVNKKSKNEIKLVNSMEFIEKVENFSQKDDNFVENGSVILNSVNLAPWVHEKRRKETMLANSSEICIEKDDSFDEFGENASKFVNLAPWVHGNRKKEAKSVNSMEIIEKDDNFDGIVENESNVAPWVHRKMLKESQLKNVIEIIEKHDKYDGSVEIDETSNEYSIFQVKSVNKSEEVKETLLENFSKIDIENEANFVKELDGFFKTDETPSELFEHPIEGESVRVPWEREVDDRVINRNTVLADKMIPGTELRRLRSVAKRMVERIKVGAAGVTEDLVETIREKWKENEIVKMKFEGAPTLNMKRTHEVLESRTGGIVIWRSGSSISLYQGMTYNLPCVQSYTNDNRLTNSHSSSTIEGDVNSRFDIGDKSTSTESSSRTIMRTTDFSENETTYFSEFDSFLEELGPRFKDWSGPPPVPVDADLLPSVDSRFKRPFRLLPDGMRLSLRDKETTFYRQSARIMPPHFALGRSRELQGLAMAMIKLFERSPIAKIAIKRGVLNTNNERMAEELKSLTGGTLLSRNKEYIVFYRGNDFLPPDVTQTLDEAHKRAMLKADEEEEARRLASISILSNKRSAKIPNVAGTLAESIAATSRWANELSPEDREKIRRESALARHASMVRYLKEKCGLAKGKLIKAEKALAKVQESMSPAELPTDLETISDEERFLFRKIGLSMKPFLLLGRRLMFDGTIENIHLHWKHREVVKLIVERKSFAQVKQIAIGLEAESGGVLVCIDKTMKGHVIILYRGKNYQRPNTVRPKNLLSKRQALARSIELQRREALKHHISNLTEKMEQLEAELEKMKSVEEIDEETFYSRMDDASSDEEMEEEGDQETFLDDSGTEEDDLY